MKLLTIKALTTALKGLARDQAEITVNLAYHSVVHGNVEVLADFKANVVNVLHKDYKQFVAASFDKKGDKWAYNKAKAIKLLASLGLEFGTATFEEFVNAITTVVQPDPVEKTDLEKKEAAIKRTANAMAALLALGLTNDELVIMAKQAKAK